MDKLKEWSEAKHGRITRLAEALGVPHSVAWRYCKGHRLVPAERALAIEEATGISRHDLRPDIYPREDAA
jgi:DNA-binding transcriptional regulator YdaS (Cro superfamily)